MPYFKWSGITTSGSLVTGKAHAQSEEELVNIITKQDIAVANIEFVNPNYLFGSKIKLRNTIISYIAILLRSGLRLPQVLDIVASLMADKKSSAITQDITFCVHAGLPFHKILAYYPDIFDQLTVQLVAIGEASGSLAQVCEYLSIYYEEQKLSSKALRSALITPAITFLFFISIVTILFIWVIPHFGTLFYSSGKELPKLTASLIGFSNFVQKPVLWYSFFAIVLLIFIVSRLFKKIYQKIKQFFFYNIPFVKKPLIFLELSLFLKALALLLSQGVHLVRALELAGQTVSHNKLRDYIYLWTQSLQKGNSLHAAIAEHSFISLIELQALIKIGEESANLDTMAAKAAEIYQERATKQLKMLTVLIQPGLLLLLGCLIGLLIFAVYLPLLTVSVIW